VCGSWKPIEDYIDSQFGQFYRDETGLNRRNIKDNRVHCCLYFIPPYGHGSLSLFCLASYAVLLLYFVAYNMHTYWLQFSSRQARGKGGGSERSDNPPPPRTKKLAFPPTVQELTS